MSSDCFDWCNWHPHVTIMGMPSSGHLTSTSCNRPRKFSYLNQRHAKSRFVAVLERMQRGNDNQTFNSKLPDGIGDLEGCKRHLNRGNWNDKYQRCCGSGETCDQSYSYCDN